MADIINIRDFKRREERKPITTADIVFKDGLPVGYVDTSPCEMPPVQPSYTAPDRDPA